MAVGGPRGIIDKAGLEARLDPATGRTLSGGHLLDGKADPGIGMLDPPLCGIADLKIKQTKC